MAVGDKQRLITSILSEVLNEKAEINKSFDWFINKHNEEHFDKYYDIIHQIFISLNGDFKKNKTKKEQLLKCDAYFGGDFNFIFEFDEIQHFSSVRLETFEYYPSSLNVNFDIEEWKTLCKKNMVDADKYRKTKTTVDFNFIGGRTAQRAYFDCFRDLLPENQGLKPTLRINEFEVRGIVEVNVDSCNKIEELLKIKLV